ncbi:GNAT family N-acetyltransferase [Paenibacillus xanthanilyticus]|uniref:GNAT family N-acetyltransferase n=1 Tax=Paenibacillus xanthanilyticus TaxID=1783531 RepID=A0ABV8JVS2_9BACL
MRETIKEGNGFIIRENGTALGEVTFAEDGPDTLIIDHTYVDPSMRGQKLGDELVRQVVDHARASGKRIVPACSFAHALFRRHGEFGDVWKR